MIFFRNTFYVSPYGEVQPCPYMPLYFGNVKEEALSNILHRMWRHDIFSKIDSKECLILNKDFQAQFIKPELILKQIGFLPGMRAADLGCGSGYFVLPAALLAGGRGRVFAVDVQKSVLEQVKSSARSQNLGNLEAVWADIEVPGAVSILNQSLDLDVFFGLQIIRNHKVTRHFSTFVFV